MPFGWGDSEQAYNQAQNDDVNEASFGHEALAGAAAFGAFKVYEDRQRKEGNTVNHAFAKEALMGLVGVEVDRLAETKGADWVDREKAKRHARENVDQMYDDHYGQQDEYDPNNRPQAFRNNDY